MNQPISKFIAVTLIASFLMVSCKDEKRKDYDCEETVDAMYDEGCELWCENDGKSAVYIDECGWFDNGDPGNFPKSLAAEVCVLMEEWAEDDECEKDFQGLLNCLAKNRADNCSEDCEDPYDDYLDCIG